MLFSKRNKKIAVVIIVIAAGCLLIRYFSQIMSFIGFLIDAVYPLILGCIMAYVLNILLKKIEKVYFPKSFRRIVKKTRRPVSILLSVLILFAIIVFTLVLVIPELYNCFEVLGKELPLVLGSLKDWINKNVPMQYIVDMVNSISLSWDGVAPAIMSFFEGGSSEIVGSVISMASSIIGTMANIIIAFVFAIYLLFNKEKLSEQLQKLVRAYFKPAKSQRFINNLDIINKTFSSFIVGQCTEAVILGILCFIGMLIFRFPYAMITGVVVGITALVPILGAFIGAAVGAFLIFTESPVKALMFIVFFIVLQQVEGDFIYPKVVGKSIGLPGIWVFAGVTVGGGLFGIIGMLFGVPTAASIYKILGRTTNEKLLKEKLVKVMEDNKTEGDTIVVKKKKPKE